MRLLQEAHRSLHSIIRLASQAIQNTEFNLLEFLAAFPSQVGILGLQMLWTRDAESALAQCRYDRKVMQETNAKFLEVLNTLIEQTTKNLDRLERIKFETLITIHVHQRDIFDQLCRSGVRSITDFEWIKQLSLTSYFNTYTYSLIPFFFCWPGFDFTLERNMMKWPLVLPMFLSPTKMNFWAALNDWSLHL